MTGPRAATTPPMMHGACVRGYCGSAMCCQRALDQPKAGAAVARVHRLRVPLAEVLAWLEPSLRWQTGPA